MQIRRFQPTFSPTGMLCVAYPLSFPRREHHPVGIIAQTAVARARGAGLSSPPCELDSTSPRHSEGLLTPRVHASRTFLQRVFGSDGRGASRGSLRILAVTYALAMGLFLPLALQQQGHSYLAPTRPNSPNLATPGSGQHRAGMNGSRNSSGRASSRPPSPPVRSPSRLEAAFRAAEEAAAIAAKLEAPRIALENKMREEKEAAKARRLAEKWANSTAAREKKEAERRKRPGSKNLPASSPGRRSPRQPTRTAANVSGSGGAADGTVGQTTTATGGANGADPTTAMGSGASSGWWGWSPEPMDPSTPAEGSVGYCVDGSSPLAFLKAEPAMRRSSVKALAEEHALRSQRPLFLHKFLTKGVLDQVRA